LVSMPVRDLTDTRITNTTFAKKARLRCRQQRRQTGSPQAANCRSLPISSQPANGITWESRQDLLVIK
jgi:hypothetical protein